MSTADTLSPLAIPGLHQRPALDDMGRSGDIYNTLPDDADQPHVSDVFITGLKNILKEFKVRNKFGLHLVHGHVKMAKGMFMVGRPMNNLSGLWTHPTKAERLELGAPHGYLSPPPPMMANDDAFITAAQKYLKLNEFAGIISIEILDQDTLGKHMKEFVLSDSDGTVMLPVDAVNPTETYRTTGWNAVEGITDLKGNETSHAKTTKGTHQVFVDGKALPDMESNLTAEEVIIKALREAGVVN